MHDSSDRTEISIRGVSRAFGLTEAVSDVSLEVSRGQTLALLGPSGCGKTTLLRMIAGLTAPDSGSIHIGDRMVAGPSVHVPPHQRGVGLVFQDGALFPHMTVLENVAYGLGSQPDLDLARRALAIVDMGDLADRRPETLSGGQRQRVALARALAPKPRVLLLDEPLASLDADLRVRIRTEMAEILHRLEITAVFVTHDQEEAFVIGDSAAVMRSGKVLQTGSPQDLYERPADPWLAAFVGDANLIDATASGFEAQTVLGPIPLRERVVGSCQVLLRPEYLVLRDGNAAVVESVEFYGHDTSYVLAQNGDRFSARLIAAPRFSEGAAVDVVYDGPPATAFAAPGR